MIKHLPNDRANKELDIDISGNFQTQSIYNTQQTIKQGNLTMNQKKQSIKDVYLIKGMSEKNKFDDQNGDSYRINNHKKQSRNFNQMNYNKQYPASMFQPQLYDRSYKIQKEVDINQQRDFDQSQSEQKIKAEGNSFLENSQKDEINQKLFSQEMLDNEQLLSMNRPLSPVNKSIDIQLQQLIQNDTSNIKYDQGDLVQHLNHNEKNIDILSQRNEIDQQKKFSIKQSKTINGMRAQPVNDYAIDSQLDGSVQNRQESSTVQYNNRPHSQTQQLRMQNIENQYFNIIMTQYNICISTLVIFMNCFTFGIFWGMLFYEYRSADHLKNIKESSSTKFILSSMENLDYEDFFIYYRLIIDTIQFLIVLIIVFGIPKTFLEISKLVCFYINFVISVFCFARMENLLYYDDVMLLKSAMKKYSQYEASNTISFKSSFENYYLMLKLYNYSIVISAIIQMLCFVYYQPNQEKAIQKSIQYEQSINELGESPKRNPQNNQQNKQNNINQQNYSISNITADPNRQSIYMFQNMLNSTVQFQNGIIQLNIHPHWKQDTPSHVHNVVE